MPVWYIFIYTKKNKINHSLFFIFGLLKKCQLKTEENLPLSKDQLIVIAGIPEERREKGKAAVIDRQG